MRYFLTFILVLLVSLVLAACGGDDGGGSDVDCDSIPVCYSNALAALKACVTDSELSITGGSENSGVIQGRECSAGTTRVTFSDYSASASGIVPIPSHVYIYQDGELCAELSAVTGSRSGTYIIQPDGSEVYSGWWPDGRSIDCGNGTVAIVDCADLADCPEAMQVPEVERDPLAVRFRNTDDSYTDLFVCQ
jgi:predicted small secreted protein